MFILMGLNSNKLIIKGIIIFEDHKLKNLILRKIKLKLGI